MKFDNLSRFEIANKGKYTIYFTVKQNCEKFEPRFFKLKIDYTKKKCPSDLIRTLGHYSIFIEVIRLVTLLSRWATTNKFYFARR